MMFTIFVWLYYVNPRYATWTYHVLGWLINYFSVHLSHLFQSSSFFPFLLSHSFLLKLRRLNCRGGRRDTNELLYEYKQTADWIRRYLSSSPKPNRIRCHSDAIWKVPFNLYISRTLLSYASLLPSKIANSLWLRWQRRYRVTRKYKNLLPKIRKPRYVRLLSTHTIVSFKAYVNTTL